MPKAKNFKLQSCLLAVYAVLLCPLNGMEVVEVDNEEVTIDLAKYTENKLISYIQLTPADSPYIVKNNTL